MQSVVRSEQRAVESVGANSRGAVVVRRCWCGSRLASEYHCCLLMVLVNGARRVTSNCRVARGTDCVSVCWEVACPNRDFLPPLYPQPLTHKCTSRDRTPSTQRRHTHKQGKKHECQPQPPACITQFTHHDFITPCLFLYDRQIRMPVEMSSELFLLIKVKQTSGCVHSAPSGCHSAHVVRDAGMPERFEPHVPFDLARKAWQRQSLPQRWDERRCWHHRCAESDVQYLDGCGVIRWLKVPRCRDCKDL